MNSTFTKILICFLICAFSAKQIDAQCLANETQIVISITTDLYPGETSWELIDQNGAGFINANPLTQSLTTYVWNICVPTTNCYTFTIFDSFGDGICCSYGNGSYSVTYGGSVVASGGSFGFSETTSSIGTCLPPALVSFCDDFESYSNGSYLAQSSSNWTTWSGTGAGTTEDVQITNTSSNSGSNSIFLNGTSSSGGPSDIVLPFSSSTPYTNGFFSFRSNFYVTSGAYFNFQAETTPGITWALDVGMNNGTINFGTYPGSWTAVYLSSTYPTNQWFELNIEIDLNSNLWEVFIDGVSQGSFANPTNQIASLDLFPLSGNQFYVDDVCYEYSTTPISTYGCTDSTAINYNPNATIDDGSCIYGPCGVDSTEIVITITTDDYPTETSWYLMDQFSGGWTNVPLTSNDANTTLTWTLCVPDSNCYTFTILDSYGDGICCAWGNGSYSVTYDGTVVASGGTFAYVQEHCNIGYCIANCNILIPIGAIPEGESCGIDANHGCDDNWKISNFTIQGVTNPWSWGYMTVLGIPVGEGNPDLYMLMRKNSNFFYYSDYYLNTWYPNSFSMYAGVSTPPLEIPTRGLFTSPYISSQTFSYEFDVWDDDYGTPVTFYGNNDYIGSYTLPAFTTASTFSITTSGGPNGNAYVDYTTIAPSLIYTPLTNGNVVHGSFWAEDNIRDSDWYDFTLNDSSTFTLNAISETPFNIMLIDASGGCDNPLVIDSAFAYGCDTISMRQTLQAGSYWLLVLPTAYSCMGCADSIDYLLDVNWINVIPPCAISTSYTINLVSCNNANSGAIDITVIGGTAPFTYNWSNGDTTEDINNLTAGSYTLTITDNYGCRTTSSVTLLPPDNPTISVNSQDIQCYGLNDGAIDITVTSGLPLYNYSWSNGATTEDINNLSAGTYSVNVTDSLGCSDTVTTTIYDNTTPIILSFVVTNESVPNANDGAIDLTVSGGVLPYSYMWSIGVFTEDLSNLSAGIYYVVVLDSNGCITNDSVVVSTTTTTIDVGIVDIVSPASGCLLDTNESVTVSIKNFLITPATNFDVVFEFGGNTYTETVTATLTTYQVLNYTFIPTIDLSLAGIYPLLTYTSSVNDIDNSNDSLSENIHNYDHDFYTADYTMSFEPFEDVTGWYMEDVNMDNVSWDISPGIGVNYSNGAFYNYNFNGITPADDWLLSQCFVLEGNVNYDISFKHRVASLVYPEDMTVMIGSGQSGIGQSDTLISMQNMINTNFDSTGVTFSVPINGIYYIGWHAESNPNMWRIDLDEINLGVSTNTVIPGCIDSTASNYNPLATVDDSSCISCIWGCMDTTSLNYDSLATCTDSSCIPTVYGCMDSTALNYYSAATVDDNSCVYIQSGCTDTAAMNYNPLAIIDDSSCVYCVYGCIDSAATNYNASATCDDGSCIYPASCTSPSPTGLNVTDLTHDRAKVNWADANTSLCLVEMYRVQYREQGTTAWSQKTALGSGLCNFGLTTTGKMLWNLTPSTTYEYRVKAWYCLSSASTWSSISTFTTLDICTNVLNFSVSSASNTQATFSWTAASTPYSFVRIKLRVDSVGSTWLTAGGYGVMYPALTRNKNGLTAGQSYRASSRTWCNPSGGAHKALTWTSFIFWTQPGSLIRVEASNSIRNLDVYPNPSRDIFNISFDVEKAQDLEIRIINVIGEVLYLQEKEKFVGTFIKQIDLAKNPKGIYFLEIETSDGTVNKKIVLN